MQKLLLVEDEVKMVRSLKKGLEEHYYQVDIAYDGEVAWKMATKNNYDLIITDIIMPGKNGIDLCRQLRQAESEVPILMLTALGTVADKVEGFHSGADDYLPKPFAFEELLVRIQSLMRRKAPVEKPTIILKIANLELNLNTKKACRDGKDIDLTAKEFALLEYFMRNKERVLSKTEIAEHVWGIDFDTGTNIVEVYINYLRKKIDKDHPNKLLHTQIGMGYIMKEK